VVELKLFLYAAMPAATPIPHPHHLFNIVGDHIPAARLVLRLHAHRNRGFGALDAAPLTLLA
jgi:hypothetical protein